METVSPKIAFLPWPTVSGPVGFALTNSINADLLPPFLFFPKRIFYDIDRLWADAKITKIEDENEK